MGWPFTFGNLTSPVAASDLDVMFNQVGAQINIPCSALGTNAISLTPLINCPALPSYNELGGYRFRAAGNSTGAVTAQYNGLGLLNVYKADGTTQAASGDVISGEQYILTFSQALNSGAGGFFLESPSVPPTPASNWFTPGGRLTLQSAVPVMVSTQTAQQIIYYAPYQHPFVPIYNGTIIAMTQFTASLADQVGLQLNMGGAANFATGTNFDVFATLSGGLKLCAVAWTNNTTRATNLSVFGGFLTNAGAATAQTGPSTSFTLPVNQGTFLGSLHTSAQGQTQFVFGGSASGGSAASFNIANYYNPVLYNTQVIDNGASYSYASTTRQARASSGNQISFIQPSSERAMIFFYLSAQIFANVPGSSFTVGLGFNSTTTYAAQPITQQDATSSPIFDTMAGLTFATTGFAFVAALETGDGVNATTFDQQSTNNLMGALWL